MNDFARGFQWDGFLHSMQLLEAFGTDLPKDNISAACHVGSTGLVQRPLLRFAFSAGTLD
jgi:hypothetical protein